MTVASRWSLQRDASGEPAGTLETNSDITARKQAEEALRRNQAAYLAEAQRLSQTGSFGWNATTGDVFWSDETFRIFGYEPGVEPSVDVLMARVHPDDAALVRGVIEHASASGEGFDLEHRLLLPDGTVKHLHVVAHPQTDSNGQDQHRFVGAVMDVTERKQAFAKLEASERRYRDLFHYMPIGLTQVDASRLIPLFKELRAQGVADLKTYIDEHPEFLPRAVEALEVEEVNRHTVELFGARNAAEMRGPITRYWQPGIPTIRRSIEARYRGEEFFQEETKVAQMDGKVVDVLFATARPGAIADKSLVGFIDITERKRTEEALRRSELRYRHLFQAMAVAFFELDFSGVGDLVRGLRASGVTDFRRHFKENPEVVRQFMRATRILDVNDQTVALFGRGSRDGLRDSVEPFWPQESTHAYAEAILSSLDRSATFQVETPLCRVDGSVFDALFTVWYSADDRTHGLGSVIDITARKQSELALRASEQRYRALFHHMPIPLWRMNSSGLAALMTELRAQGVTDLGRYMDERPDFLKRAMDALFIEEVNRSTIDLFGEVGETESAGSINPYWQAGTDTIRRTIEARFRDQLSYQEETKLTTRDGRVLEGLYTSAFPPALSDLGMSISSFVDGTERINAQARLQQVQADFAHAARVSMLGELTASIAHEVNQPLAAIATNGEAGLRWLARPEPDVAEVSELIKHIVADARRAATIISRIRDMAARRVPEQALLAIDDVVREALVFLRHEVQARGVTVVHYPLQAAPQVLADRTQLQQVIVNLAVNAMQAMAQAESRERRIAIRTSVAPDADSVACAIEDSGPGIAPENLARLFDSFFTTKSGGMGMGLPICRSIIEAHGGHITADTDRSGARFVFTLPAAQ